MSLVKVFLSHTLTMQIKHQYDHLQKQCDSTDGNQNTHILWTVKSTSWVFKLAKQSHVYPGYT